MPVVIQGQTKYRKHQFARETTFGTAVAAVRAYPFSGVPTPNIGWTQPQDADFGSIDPVEAPYLSIPDLAASLTMPRVSYNDLPLLLCGFFGGAVDPTGGGDAQTWNHMPASESPDTLDSFTYEFGDDVTDDWYQFTGGVIEQMTISSPVGLGPISASTSWRFADVTQSGSTDFPVSGTVPTPDLTVDRSPIPVYAKDASFYIDSAAGNIGDTQILNAVHNWELTLTRELDQKRFQNGSQSFALSGYGAGARSIGLKVRFAKTSDTVGTGSESDAWMSDTSVDRFVRIAFLASVLAESPSTYYSWVLDLPMRYMTREEDAEGGNSVVALSGNAFLEPDTFGGVFESTAVNTLTAVGPAAS